MQNHTNLYGLLDLELRLFNLGVLQCWSYIIVGVDWASTVSGVQQTSKYILPTTKTAGSFTNKIGSQF